jgi:hypothetical protein
MTLGKESVGSLIPTLNSRRPSQMDRPYNSYLRVSPGSDDPHEESERDRESCATPSRWENGAAPAVRGFSHEHRGVPLSEEEV